MWFVNFQVCGWSGVTQLQNQRLVEIDKSFITDLNHQTMIWMNLNTEQRINLQDIFTSTSVKNKKERNKCQNNFSSKYLLLRCISRSIGDLIEALFFQYPMQCYMFLYLWNLRSCSFLNILDVHEIKWRNRLPSIINWFRQGRSVIFVWKIHILHAGSWTKGWTSRQFSINKLLGGYWTRSLKLNELFDWNFKAIEHWLDKWELNYLMDNIFDDSKL